MFCELLDFLYYAHAKKADGKYYQTKCLSFFWHVFEKVPYPGKNSSQYVISINTFCVLSNFLNISNLGIIDKNQQKDHRWANNDLAKNLG